MQKSVIQNSNEDDLFLNETVKMFVYLTEDLLFYVYFSKGTQLYT